MSLYSYSQISESMLSKLARTTSVLRVQVRVVTCVFSREVSQDPNRQKEPRDP